MSTIEIFAILFETMEKIDFLSNFVDTQSLMKWLLMVDCWRYIHIRQIYGLKHFFLKHINQYTLFTKPTKRISGRQLSNT